MTSQIPDPFINKNPIPVASTSFYEREQEFTQVENLLRAGMSVSLVGERKAGKTSFLNHLLTRLSVGEFIPVFVDAQLALPPKDKVFLDYLISRAVRAIQERVDLSDAQVKTPATAPDDLAYQWFEAALNTLRSYLPIGSNGQRCRVVWLVDEVEMLRSYQGTNLFSLARSLVQTDPDFQLIIAGYDVLYTLSNWSDWSPFFNAFSHIKLEWLNPIVAQQLIDDALATMGVTIDPDLYDPILEWTGQKPFFLKWVMSKAAIALNQQERRHINKAIWEAVKDLFLSDFEISQHFTHLWNAHTTDNHQRILSLIAPRIGPFTLSQILRNLKERNLTQDD